MTQATLERDDAIGIVRLNRPESLNAINGELLTALHDVLDEAMGDPSIRVVVLTGNGRAFCAGDDLKDFSRQSATRQSIEEHIERIQLITCDLMFCDKPVIGAVHGYAVGGGFEWMLNCDIVVASESLVAFFPEMKWGQFVTGGISHLLTQSVGYQRAMELWLLGERQSAERLLQLGLVNRVVPDDAMLPAALAIARAVAGQSTNSVRRLKRLANRELSEQLARSLMLEKEAAIDAFSDPDAASRARGFTTAHNAP
ncbi:enoyl-CoA hydratase/isomerase family protein [Paraburkholderia sediminicola]|jgi:enoyl-CoA hydratase/carnithine racemase|uniref:enoyl-CoA hydratase/isomerase family protein n=1 Tax=Paraburkholderia sediminicola TaxID=458836 RepID=UPI000E75D255